MPKPDSDHNRHLPDSAAEFRSKYSEFRVRTDSELNRILRTRRWPDSLLTAVRYSLNAGGKRLRPVMCLMAAELCGGSTDAALAAACAVEMIHTYSLIHDDLPCMDDDDLRRGRPTSHRVFGEALAVLAGDVLQPLAFEVLASANLDPSRIAHCCRILSSAAGGIGMVGGQVLDLEAERGEFPGVSAVRTEEPDRTDRSDRSPANEQAELLRELKDSPAAWETLSVAADRIRVAQLIRIHRMKTGALITSALELGAVCAGGGPEAQRAVVRYGECCGLAFQIADDLLDITGTDDRLGKQTGRDQELGKLTYPAVMGITASRSAAETLIAAGCEALKPFGAAADPLKSLARFVVERDH